MKVGRIKAMSASAVHFGVVVNVRVGSSESEGS